MSADFRCECGHAMSKHAIAGSVEVDALGGGCGLCDCTLNRLQEPGFPSPVQEAATSIHELFQSYIAAGFSREESLHLTTAVTVEGMRQASP